MNVTGGARRKNVAGKPAPKKQTKRSKSKSRERSRKVALPKTVRAMSKKSKSFKRMKASRASSMMSLTELQFLAKSRGIPFGGLTKTKLVRKINNYF